VNAAAAVEAGNKIERLQVVEQGGVIYVRVGLENAPAGAPPSFSIASPPRIAFDFQATSNALGRSLQTIDQGDLKSANIVQVGDRTRLVLNLTRMAPFEARVDGNDVVIALSPVTALAPSPAATEQSVAHFEATKSADSAGDGKSVRDVVFRRGKDGEARIVVDLSNPDTGIDVRKRGKDLVVEFLKTSLPEQLRKKSDVTDFGTPVLQMIAQESGEFTRLVVTPQGLGEHTAYRSDDEGVVEGR
jgi:type IV pilus assembly protein PilQ